MDLERFRKSMNENQAPSEFSLPLQALWSAGRGEWDQAHDLIQDESSRECCLVHALVHRQEGDLSNARYWYDRAGMRMAEGPIEDEWETIVASLLC